MDRLLLWMSLALAATTELALTFRFFAGKATAWEWFSGSFVACFVGALVMVEFVLKHKRKTVDGEQQAEPERKKVEYCPKCNRCPVPRFGKCPICGTPTEDE